MKTNWPQLTRFIYPGRFLILGRVGNEYYGIYGVTARSASSRAKRYVYDENSGIIKVESTDMGVMSQGNLDLLDYNAGHIFENGIVLGNGKQTDLVKLENSAIQGLIAGLQTQNYEPDKYNTPRITAAIQYNSKFVSAGMYIIRAGANSEPIHNAYEMQLNPGQGYFISTYDGPNIKPTPSFSGDPILIDINFSSEQDAVEKIWNYFAPQSSDPDLRVSIIAVKLRPQSTETKTHIINKY